MRRTNPYEVVELFERAIADYTGSPYVVAVDSCTDAILLACKIHSVDEVSIPAHTYVSVPNSIIHAGGSVVFRDDQWRGGYQLQPYPIWDCAKRFTSGMYQAGQMQCVSFQYSKILGIGKGGAILTDDADAVEQLRKMRFNGRSAVPLEQDGYTSLGYNMTMTPEQAARGLSLLFHLPDHNADQIMENFADLRQYPVFAPTI